MKVIGVIPARYNSTRLPGKALADIHGYPMIWWVYEQVKKVPEFFDIYVATDDTRIANICKRYRMKYLMTSVDTPNHIHRIWEVSNTLAADYYISINGDEPLINENNIRAVFPDTIIKNKPYFGSVYKQMTNPTEVMDTSNVKIVLDVFGKCMYQSRMPIPFPKGSILFEYKKAIGIECFNKKCLDIFVNSPMCELEKIEDIDHLRFLQNGIPIYYKKVDSDSFSVDTQNDLEKVRIIISERTKD